MNSSTSSTSRKARPHPTTSSRSEAQRRADLEDQEREYRSRAVREPRKVLSEFGLNLPDNVKVQVHDSTADMRYLVLPMRPEGTEGWSAEQLAETVGRDSMIGVAVPQV